jgi:SagB-type dehydrogenase family enzyme
MFLRGVFRPGKNQDPRHPSELPEGPPDRRVYPSSGGLFTLEVYPLVQECTGIQPGLYYYDPFCHELETISQPLTEPLNKLITTFKWMCTGYRAPQVVILLSARFTLKAWRYSSIAYSLILKDVGVLLESMYLNATDLGLAGCAVGTGDSGLFAEATGIDPFVETTVGEFIVGSAPNDLLS